VRNEDITTFSLSAIGLSVSLTDFKNWLDIILIILSILNVSIILLIKLRKYLKDGKLDKDEIKDISEDINHIKDDVKKLNKEDRGNEWWENSQSF